MNLEFHQNFALSPFPFLSQAITEEFETGCQREPLYAEDFALIADSVIE